MKILILLMSSFVVGCSMLKPYLDVDSAKKVKRVAIVAFEVQQSMPTDSLGISAIKNMIKNKKKSYSPQQQKMTQLIYKNLVRKMTVKTGWKVMSGSQMMKNDHYANLVSEKMQGARLTSMTSKKAILIDHNGMMDIMAFRRMSESEKNQLAQALGVDALAEFTVIESIKQSMLSVGHFSGNAPFKYTARANLQLYATTDFKKPIWRIQNIDGEPFSSKELAKELHQTEKIGRVGYKAAESSIDVMMSNYSL